MDTTLAEKVQEIKAPRAQFFSLKTPYMKQGRMTPVVAKTDNLKINVKVNAEGGENGVHAHLDQDHAFIVLEGQMSIFDEKGNEKVVKRYQGVMLPKGAYYRYLNTGEGNLVLLRVSAPVQDKPRPGLPTRVRPDGKELDGRSAENKTLPPIKEPGKFFAESAGLD